MMLMTMMMMLMTPVCPHWGSGTPHPFIRQENKDQEKLLLSWMHILDVNTQPSSTLFCAIPKWGQGQRPARVGCPPSLVQNVPKATPVLVTAQPSCSALCREDEEEPNLIYSLLHFPAK